MGRILIADDEQDFVWALRRSLSAAGHVVFTAKDGVEALALARRHPPDLILLDIAMPTLDGLQVIRRLRGDSGLAAIPVLFLTARSAVEDRIKGLEAGGDDYLMKPFDLRELRARISALLRRDRGDSARRPSRIAIGPLAINVEAREAYAGGEAIHLTPIEFDLLYFFMSYPGEFFSGADLLQLVWGYRPDSADSGIVRWHIKRLRDKLEADRSHPACIRTVPGHGYGLSEALIAKRRGRARRPRSREQAERGVPGGATEPVAPAPDPAASETAAPSQARDAIRLGSDGLRAYNRHREDEDRDHGEAGRPRPSP